MKKIIATSLLILSALASISAKPKLRDESLIRVGVCAGPYGDMFREAISPKLKEKGYKVRFVEFSDYVQPNNALAENEIDVNAFQHSTYLKKFSSDHNLDLTYITEIPTAAMAIFSSKYSSLQELPKGALVAIPNDDTNLARALRVLDQTKEASINPNVNASKATVKDVTINPKNFKFKEVSAELLPSILDSVGIAIINGNYALEAGLKLDKALYNEKLLPGYYNVIAVRTSDAEKEFVKDIYAIVHSDFFRSIIEDPSKQYIAFGRPADYNK